MIKIGTTRNVWDKMLANFLHTELTNLHIENHLVYLETEKAIENALFSEEIDIFIRPLRDLPIKIPMGMTIAALSMRLDPAVFLVRLKNTSDTGGGILGLADGAKILAKTNLYAQQFKDLGFNFDFNIKNLNNPTENINYLNDKTVDACLTSQHVINVLELNESEYDIIRLQPREIVPEIAQGVAAAVTRTDDLMTRRVAQKLHNPRTAEVTNVERTMLKMYAEKNIEAELAVFCERDAEGNCHVVAFDSRGRRARVSSATHFQLAETVFQELNT